MRINSNFGRFLATDMKYSFDNMSYVCTKTLSFCLVFDLAQQISSEPLECEEYFYITLNCIQFNCFQLNSKKSHWLETIWKYFLCPLSIVINYVFRTRVEIFLWLQNFQQLYFIDLSIVWQFFAYTENKVILISIALEIWCNEILILLCLFFF